MSQSSYSDYVRDEHLHDRYGAYQERYAQNIRESDRVLVELIAEALGDGSRSLLDIGCHTGNLLMHMRSRLPNARLSGGDMAASVIEAAQRDPRLEGIDLRVMDMLAIEGMYDVIVANAVAVYFTIDEYDQAIASIAAALHEGGTYVAFEWLHPFPQELQIKETSRSHPEGLTINFRPYSQVEKILRRNGFRSVAFKPFEIPIDLERGATYGDNADGFEDLNTHTVRTEDGQRLLFRGTLHQPWCHLVATK
jgi:cyclopropane fatty-acyl-phospholipid synthase-like methyltransferase